jgi:hypothetical protein
MRQKYLMVLVVQQFRGKTRSPVTNKRGILEALKTSFFSIYALAVTVHSYFYRLASFTAIQGKPEKSPQPDRDKPVIFARILTEVPRVHVPDPGAECLCLTHTRRRHRVVKAPVRFGQGVKRAADRAWMALPARQNPVGIGKVISTTELV